MHTYDSYKDSGIDWLGEIPSHWEVEKGKWLFIKQERPVFNHYEVITCFRDGQVTLRKNRREDGFTNSLKEIGYQGILKGDLVIHQMDAFAGAIGVSDSDGKSTPVYSVCTPRKNNVNNYYYAYLLRSMALSGFILSLAKGIRERSTDFRFNDFSGLSYPLPPLHEQEAIARFLDDKCAKIDELVAIKEQQIDKLKELRQVKIHHAVTKGINPNVEMKDSGIDWIGEIPKHWEVKKLKSIATIVLGKMLCNEDKGNYEYKPYLKSKNIQWLNVNVDSVDYMWFSKAEQLQYKLMKGDLILSEGGEVGKVCIWNDELEECYIQNSVHKVTVDKLNNSKFYLYSFFTIGKLGIFESIVNKVSIGHLTREKLVNILVPVPPLPEQEAIVAYLDEAINKIDQAIAQREAQIEKLKAYKQSLINEVVTGKVKVC